MMRKVILTGLLAGAWIVALCHAAHGQCYGASSYRSYAPSYSYSAPSYSYAQSYSYAPAYVAPKKEVYKNDAYFIRLTAFFPVLDVPTYGTAVYAQPGLVTPQTAVPQTPGTQAPVTQMNDMSKLLEAIKLMNKSIELVDARLNKLEGGNGNGGGTYAPKGPPQGQPPPKQQAEPPPAGQTAQQIVAAKCAVCHNPDKAETWGNGFVMVGPDGKLEKLSDKAVKKVVKHCMAGTMPLKEADLKDEAIAKKMTGFKGKFPEPLTDQEAGALVSFYSGATKSAREERLEIAEVRPQARKLVRKQQ